MDPIAPCLLLWLHTYQENRFLENLTLHSQHSRTTTIGHLTEVDRLSPTATIDTASERSTKVITRLEFEKATATIESSDCYPGANLEGSGDLRPITGRDVSSDAGLQRPLSCTTPKRPSLARSCRNYIQHAASTLEYTSLPYQRCAL